MLKPGRRLPVGSRFGIDGVFSAEVLSKDPEGNAAVRFYTFGNEGVLEMSERIGVVPLPPYIARDQKSPGYDREFDNASRRRLRRRGCTLRPNSTKNCARAGTLSIH